MTTPRRIVLVQAGLGAGGAEKIVNLIARRRLDRGDEVHVLAFDGDRAGSYFAYPDGVQISTLSSSARGGGKLRSLARLRWLAGRLKALQPDLVVSFLTKVNVLTLLAATAIRLPAPVIVSERNNPLRQNAHPAWRLLTRAVSGRAARLVMQTEAARGTLPAALQPRSVVIPNPCAAPETAGAAPERTAFVAVGRLDPQKGFDRLIDAFAVPALAGMRLTIWGEGGARARLEAQIAARGLGDRVRLPGRTQAPGAWIDPDATFVLSSRFEGFPNVLAEAMSAGMASVAFDCDWGPSELIEDGVNGFLVADGDTDALSAAMARLGGDPALRARLGAAAQETATRFSAEAVLAQWDAAFDGVCGETVARPRSAAAQTAAADAGAPR